MRLPVVFIAVILSASLSCGDGGATGLEDTGDNTPTSEGDDDSVAPPQDGDSPPACVPSLDVPASRSGKGVIVTRTALAGAFQPYAELHTVMGVDTSVVTIESLCGSTCDDSDGKKDTAKRIKDYLAGQAGLAYVVLGGDLEVVPSRRVYDSYQNPIATDVSFSGYFYTDHYFADFSQWDGNGNGLYAEEGADHPDYFPEVAVGRVPVSTPQEATAYFDKMLRYVAAYPAPRATKGLLVSDVAVTYVVDVDSAWYFESPGRTSSLFPSGFSVDKLYATRLTPDPAAPSLTLSALTSALEAGYNLVVHNGHSSERVLFRASPDSFDGARAYAMHNDVYPVVLSCGCLAGNFAEPDRYATDSAGELLVNAPQGGAIAYIGNVPLGLGLAGGSQFIDEFLRYASSTPQPLIGDAARSAHETLPESDDFELPYVGVSMPVVDADSYAWTQKAIALLGNPLLPIWTTAPTPAPTVTVTRAAACSDTRLTVTLSSAAQGKMRLLADGVLYEKTVGGNTVSFTVPGNPARLALGLLVPGSLWRYLAQ